MGHVPSFKNGKLLTRGRLITHPAKQKWMKKAARSIESQLRSALQITETGTLTEPTQRSLILTSLLLEDSLAWIGAPCGRWLKVKKGEEGADITIEAL